MIELVSCDLMRKSDENTIRTKTPSTELMWRAGLGIYNSAKWQGKIGIVCGSGNNAGDGYALALILKENKIACDLILLSEKLSVDAEYYFKKCRDVSINTVKYTPDTPLDGYDMIVDCIFGTGFKGEAQGVYAEAIEKINKSSAFVISADINSGLNGDNGMCKTAIKSDLTVSIGTRKSGHYLAMAKDHIKRLVNVDIGIDLVDTPMYLIEASDAGRVYKPRLNFSHKGTYGYVAIIGGCEDYSGAPRLSALALSALRAGAGVSKVCVPKSISNIVSASLIEPTMCALSEQNGYIKFVPEEIDKALRGVRSVAIGMGMGQGSDAYKIIKHILENYELTVIIDADGLNDLSKNDMTVLKNTKCTVILTPHMAELSRLSGVSISKIYESPIKTAEDFAKEYGAVVLLKGASTIVTDGKNTRIVDTGCAGMATAGSGDVLSGIILGTVAQNPIREQMLLNVCASAYVNGLAGQLASEQYGDISMISTDTISKIAEAIKSLPKQ
ncbi:MAG: NAD(P)H-hydrate dehydratase [Clostridia bacterium]|nr:NAD(P)H-hydrate dehydratase [Clostridia bacterium]MBQ8739717.1 NAD(P)H-hydrate dehydratase [Clostridia bacterium]